jgi:hypothetical protein
MKTLFSEFSDISDWDTLTVLNILRVFPCQVQALTAQLHLRANTKVEKADTMPGAGERVKTQVHDIKNQKKLECVAATSQ